MNNHMEAELMVFMLAIWGTRGGACLGKVRACPKNK